MINRESVAFTAIRFMQRNFEHLPKALELLLEKDRLNVFINQVNREIQEHTNTFSFRSMNDAHNYILQRTAFYCKAVLEHRSPPPNNAS